MEDLSESHWNDVVTSSTTLQRYEDIMHENGFQDSDDEDRGVLSNPVFGSHSPVDDNLVYPAGSGYSYHDDAHDDETIEQEVEQLDDENKNILKALTQTQDSESESHELITKDDKLFSNIDVGPIQEAAAGSASTNSDLNIVKKRTTNIMYKSPRFRRSAVKKKSVTVEVHNDNDGGPLGSINDEEDENNDGLPSHNQLESPQRRERLINSIDKPLFEINSKPLGSKAAADSSKSLANNEESTDSTVKSKDDQNPEFHFEISVGDPHKIGSELLNAHIQYSVITKSNFPVFEKVDEIIVERRYNDFLWLYNQLIYNHPGYVIPPPPEKQAVGRFNKNFIENRRLSLEKMLTNISQHAVLQKDQDFIIFLTSENFHAESKYREHNVEPEEDSGFMSSITGAFSSQPKYVEQDPFFVDQQLYIEQLDSNLKNLYKSLEAITSTRTDLLVSVEEFDKCLGKIAELEINTDLTLIFTNYNELVSKIHDNIERFSMSEMLTIGNTVDEYIRTIGSVKTIFDQRNKLVSGLNNNEANLDKKQKNLSKFKLKFHNQIDKIKKYELEIEALQKLVESEKSKKLELVDRIKIELQKFDNNRLTDFKAAFEIYWESLIESQKELIELWETFYDKCKF